MRYDAPGETEKGKKLVVEVVEYAKHRYPRPANARSIGSISDLAVKGFVR